MVREPAWIDVEIPYDGINGKLWVLGQLGLPFDVRRVFWITNVPGDHGVRANHAHKTCEQILIPIVGKMTASVTTPSAARAFQKLAESPVLRYRLEPKKCLWVPTYNWLRLTAFSPNAVCLVLCSEAYDEASYVRDWEEFRRLSSLCEPGTGVSA